MKKLLVAVLLLSLFQLAPAGENILPNPGFEQVDNVQKLPLQWGFGRNGAEGTAVSDNLNASGGKYSVRMQQTSPKGWMALAHTITLSAPTTADRPITVSVRVNTDNLAQGMLVIIAGTKEQPQKQWEQAAFWAGSFGWKTFQKKMILKAGASQVSFSIRTSGKGLMWVDDASFSFDDEQSTVEYQNLLRNGDLTGPALADTGLPAGWVHNSIDALEAIGTASWNPEGCKTPGSLVLQWQSGSQKFGVEAALQEQIKPSCSYEASAMVKTAADGKALFSVIVLDATGQKAAELYSDSVTGTDWQPLKFEFITPPNAASLRFSCFSGGTGMVQFDTVSLKETGKKVEEQPLPLEARCLPVEWNADWNKGSLEFNSFVDAPIPLAFHFQGRIKELKNAALIVDFPAQVQMVEAYPTHAGWYGEEKFTTENIKRPEGEYVRYRFSPRAFAILTPSYTYERKIAMLLMPRDGAGAAGKVFWHLENDGRKNREKSFELNFLPPLSEQQLPDNFHLIRWEAMDYQIPSDGWFEKSLSVLERAGFKFHAVTGGTARSNRLKEIMESRGWNFNYSLIEYLYVKYNAPDMLKALGDRIEYVVRDNGQLNKELFCPDFVVDDPEYIRLFNESFSKSLKARGLKSGEWVALDLEPFGTMQWCFCERSRKKFAQRLKLDTVPDVKEIKAKYSNEWVQFRCENTSLQVKHYAEVIRATVPGAVVVDYDYIVDFTNPGYRSAYAHVAKDPELNEQYIDQHLSSYYHTVDKRAFDMMKINGRHLQKPYLPICAISGLDYLVASEVMTPAQVRMMMLASAVNGCNGFAVYPGIHLDGKFLQAFHRGTGEVTALQRFFKNAKTDAPGVAANARHYRESTIQSNGSTKTLRFPIWSNYFAFSAIQLENERLVSLFNYHPAETMFVDVTAAPGNGEYTVLDPIRNKLLVPAPGRTAWSVAELKKGVLAEVRPHDVRFLLIRPVTPGDEALPVETSQPAVEQKFQQTKNNFGNSAMVKPVKSGNLEIKITDADNDGAPELELHSPGQMLRVDYSTGGAISEWRTNGKTVAAGTGVLFSEERIWLPAEARELFSRSAEVESAVIQGDELKVVLKKTAATLPLTLQKTITVKAAVPGFTVDYRLSNNSPTKCRISLWVKNALPGNPVYLNERGGKLTAIDPSPGEHVYTVEKGTHPGFPDNIERGTLSGAASAVQLGNIELKVTNDFTKLMNYYHWTSPTLATWEWMYKSVELAQGQSWSTSVNYTLTGR